MAIFNSYVKLPEGIWRHKGLYVFSVSECPFCSDGPTSGRTLGTQFDEAVLLYAVSAWWTCEEEHCRLCVFSHVTWIQQVGAFCSSVDCVFFLDPFGSLKRCLLPFLPLSQQKNGKICVQDLWPTNHWAEQWISSLLLGWATEGGFSTLVSAFVIHSPSWIFLNFLSRAPQQADPQTVSSQEVIQFTWKVPSYALDRSNHFDPRWSNHYFFKIIFDN